MITAIGTFAKPGQIDKLGALPLVFLFATVFCFTVSIIAAAFLLKSLPARLSDSNREILVVKE